MAIDGHESCNHQQEICTLKTMKTKALGQENKVLHTF